MNVKTTILFVIVLMLVLCGNALALTYYWDGGGAGDLWTTQGNWSPNGMPGYDDYALVEDGNVVGQPLIDSTVTASHQKVRVGTDQTGCSITMTGGSLEANHTSFGFILALNATGEGSLYMSGDSNVVCAKGFWAGGHGSGHLYMSGNSSITNVTTGVAIGYYSDGSGTLTMSDNSSIVVSATQNFMVGGQGYGELNMTGGSISTGKFFVGWSGGTGNVQFDGGTIYIAGYAGGFSMQPGSQMDITGGVMTIAGSRVAHMRGFVTGGQLSGYGYYDLDHVAITYYPASQTTKVIAIIEDPNKIISIEETFYYTVVNESGRTDNYTIVLVEEPNAGVDILVHPDSNAMDIDLGAGAGVDITLHFLPEDYNIPQDVNIIAVDDLLVENMETSTITHTVTSSDPRYNGESLPDVNVRVMDNDRLADLVRDGHIDLLDLGALCRRWLAECGSDDWCGGGDMTGIIGQTESPGIVNFGDFAILAAHWLEGPLSMPRVMRNILWWRSGSLFSSFSPIDEVNPNVLHTFPKPTPDMTAFRPPEALQIWCESTWIEEVEQLHNAGIKVYASQSSNIFKSSIFTEWDLDPEIYYARDPLGNPQTWGGSWDSSCTNIPAWMSLHEQTALIFASAGFDGIWYDLNCNANSSARFCHCDYCRAKWHDYMTSEGLDPNTPQPTKANGYDMTQSINRRHLLWRLQCWEDAWTPLIEKVKADYPEFTFSHNLGAKNARYIEGIYFHSMTNIFDYVHYEQSGHGCAPYSLIPDYLSGLAAGAGKPVVLVRTSNTALNSSQLKISLSEAHACGGSNQNWIGWKSEYREIFDFVENYEDYYNNTESGANVAVVLSWWSRVIYEGTNGFDNLRWMGQMLLDMHVPFDYIIAERDLTDPNALLAKYDTIILTDFACMTDEQINTLTTYLHNGGGIFATFNTGKYDDEYATRSPSGLDLITGQSITGTCQLEIGDGRFAYFDGFPEKDHWDNNPRDLQQTSPLPDPTPPPADVNDAMHWVFNDSLPLGTDAKITTAIILKKQRDHVTNEDRILVHLVNYNTYPDGQQLTPDEDIGFIVTIPAGKTVSEVLVISPDFIEPLTAQTLAGWSVYDNKLHIVLAELQHYAVIVINM